MRDLRLKHIALIFSFVLLACQDQNLESETEPPVDPDMEDALALADEFLATARNQGTDLDVTVLKYRTDLVYNTNGLFGGYDFIDEMTVTAESQPGGRIFWFACGGVQELISIEMDEASAEALGNHLPFEVVPGRFWSLWIPFNILNNVGEDSFHLKYDIVYKNNLGEIIRLDPKLQISNES